MEKDGVTFFDQEKVEKYRGPASSMFPHKKGDLYGFFFIPDRKKPTGPKLKVLVSPWDCKEGNWRHISVSHIKRCPTWGELCQIKEMFWGPDVTVQQFHPKASEYVNNANNCLHMWEKVGTEAELPPSILTGIKEMGVLK